MRDNIAPLPPVTLCVLRGSIRFSFLVVLLGMYVSTFHIFVSLQGILVDEEKPARE
jgi:hypothetical protein